MSADFNVAEDPWIPVVGPDGQVREVGLRAALLQAHEFVVVRDPIPLVEFGLHRLLTAFVLDIFQPDGLEGLLDLLEQGRFDAERINAYFDRHADRFHLFDEAHPFLQTPGMEAEAAKPLAAIAPLTPSGCNVRHFHHAHEEEFGISPAAAARLLTTLAPFATEGGRTYYPSINGTPPWYVVVRGDNLFQTLCLNVPCLPMDPTGYAPVAWLNNRTPGGERRKEWSLLEALTWRPRRIRLIPTSRGPCSLSGTEVPAVVRTVKFAGGDGCQLTWRDPSVAYRLDATKKTAASLKPQEGRAVWRDTGPLALLTTAAVRADTKVAFERPALVSQYAHIAQTGALPKQHRFRLTVYSIRTRQDKVLEWQREDITLPAPLVWRSRFAKEAQRAMDQASEVARHLRMAVKRAHPLWDDERRRKWDKSPQMKAQLDNAAARAERLFWNSLREPYFEHLNTLASLESDEVPAQLQAHWAVRVKAVAKSAFNTGAGDMHSSGIAMRRVVKANEFLLIKLAIVLATDGEKANQAKRRGEKTKARAGATQGELDL